ncbi:MAG: hypothetical protein GWN14_15735, partial [candidate division Zixibacteria bacterium]|nr:hypothetical protein [candidate division Zixibacteria bacterium]NIX57331.1 hypothetical protein [candidate division Zixibacteria bacterium]
PPVGSSALPPDEVDRILAEIQKRNDTVEDKPDWIKRAYSGLMLRKLTNVSREEYKKYEEYLDNGSAYVIVHPGFFSFFHFPRKL